MTFDEYQKIALNTAYTDDRYKGDLMEKTIWAMGVVGESGEVIEKWKKIIAYQKGQIEPADIEDLAKELGDVIWYIAVFADSLGLSLADIIDSNIQKLASRQLRGTIKGSGDNR